MPKTARHIGNTNMGAGDARVYLLREPYRNEATGADYDRAIVVRYNVPHETDPDAELPDIGVYGAAADTAVADKLGSLTGTDVTHAEALTLVLGYELASGAASLPEMVAEFHVAFGHPIAKVPGLTDAATTQLRIDLLREEFEEYLEAVEAGDLVAIGDALQDMKYVIAGTELVYGLPADELVQIVHAANMDKLELDGTVRRRPDGKTLKREGWLGPEAAIKAALTDAGAVL